MAEKGESFSDNSSHLPSSEPVSRKARIDSLAVVKLERSTSPQRSGSRSPVPAWRRTVDLKTPPPPPSPPPSRKVTSVFTALFSKIKLQKVEPTGVRPVDARCDGYHVPILYNKQYDIPHEIKKIGLPKQPILLDKSAKVFSAIKSSYIIISYS